MRNAGFYIMAVIIVVLGFCFSLNKTASAAPFLIVPQHVLMKNTEPNLRQSALADRQPIGWQPGFRTLPAGGLNCLGSLPRNVNLSKRRCSG